jgi:hypothetical protein
LEEKNMAVVNRGRGADKPPKWFERGRARPAAKYAGPAEAAKIIFSGRWNYTPKQLAECVRGCDEKSLIAELKAVCATQVRLVWSPGFSHAGDQAQWTLLRDLVPRLKRSRIHPIAYLSLTNCFWREMLPEVPEAEAWLQRDGQGRFVPYDFADYRGQEPDRRLLCVNQPGWRAYLKYKVSAAVEAGFAGLFFDNLFSRCQCATCREAFRVYAEKKYGAALEWPTEEPQGVQGRDGAGARGLEFTEALSDVSSATAVSRLALNACRLEALAAGLKELRQAAEAARERPADPRVSIEPLLFYVNAHERYPLNEVGNALLGEDSVRPGFAADGKRLITNVGLWKFLFEDGGRDKPFENGIGRAADVPDTPRSRVLAWAEELACGGAVVEESSQSLPEACSRFIAEHGDLYLKTDPVNPCGLVMREQGFLAEKKAAFSLLARRNIQFDVIPCEQLGRFALSRYRVLYLRDLRHIGDGEAEAFRQFAAQGGTLLATGDCGVGDQLFRPRDDYALADVFGVHYAPNLRGRFENSFGQGKAVFYPEKLEELWETDAACEWTEPFFQDLTVGIGKPPLTVEAPDGVCAFLWGRGTRRYVHLLNYRAEAVPEIRVTLPECGGRVFRAHSPDVPPPTVEPLEIGYGRDVFFVRGLDVYAVVEVLEASAVRRETPPDLPFLNHSETEK